ncbi:MAG: TIGR02466 family protein [Synechococcaceae cyanobacterium]
MSSPPPAPLPRSTPALQLQPLFPLGLGQVQLRPDPLDTALQIQAIQRWRGGSRSNPNPGCAWTGDLHGLGDLHRRPPFEPLLAQIALEARGFLQQLGFNLERLALHLQRSWPVLSEAGQVVGRHHHPNAHLSAVYYLNGDGSGRSGCLRLYPPRQLNELVPGLAVGHDGPLGADSDAARQWNAPWHDVAPRAGLLLLFPAGLDHAVLENQDPDDHRYSLSADFVLSAPAAAGPSAAEYLAPHPQHWQAVDPAP